MLTTPAPEGQITCTVFASLQDTMGTRHVTTMQGLADWLRSLPPAQAKEGLPLIKLATFSGGCGSEHLQAVYGIEGDYDGHGFNLAPAGAATMLQAAGIAALVYSTPSNRPDAPRWRVLCPLSGPVAPDARHALVQVLNGALGGCLARESFTAAQRFYAGSVAGGQPVEIHASTGQLIDRITGIAPIGPPASTSERQPLGSLPAPAVEIVEAALSEIDPGQLDYAGWRDVTAAYRGAGGRRAAWDAWCSGYERNDMGANEKLWRSLDKGTALGWSYLARHAPAAAAQAAWGAGPAGGAVQVLAASPFDLPHGAETTGGPSHLDVVKTCRDWRLPLGHDEFAGRIMVTGPLPGERSGRWPRPLVDRDYVLIRLNFNSMGQKPPTEALREGVEMWAFHNPFNPVTDWLRSLQWDGTARLDHWLARYIGVAPSPWATLAGSKFLIAMVARAMQPGCKVDTALVIDGPQGAGKSTALRILAGDEHFGDQLPNIRDKEGLHYLQGLWLVEIAELAAIRKAELEDVKKFITAQFDRYRPPYARQPVERPRQCVFAATTNEVTYLRDPTGDRRWWPVTAGPIDTEALARDREQLFAEAMQRYTAGEVWHLSPAQEALARVEQGKRREVSEWFGRVAAICEGQEMAGGLPLTMQHLFTALGLPSTELSNPKYSRPLAGDLAALGWRQDRTKRGRFYVKGGDTAGDTRTGG